LPFDLVTGDPDAFTPVRPGVDRAPRFVGVPAAFLPLDGGVRRVPDLLTRNAWRLDTMRKGDGRLIGESSSRLDIEGGRGPELDECEAGMRRKLVGLRSGICVMAPDAEGLGFGVCWRLGGGGVGTRCKLVELGFGVARTGNSHLDEDVSCWRRRVGMHLDIPLRGGD
jgi:hypothetical protein